MQLPEGNRRVTRVNELFRFRNSISIPGILSEYADLGEDTLEYYETSETSRAKYKKGTTVTCACFLSHCHHVGPTMFTKISVLMYLGPYLVIYLMTHLVAQ